MNIADRDKLFVASFAQPTPAREAIRELRHDGFGPNEIGVVCHDGTTAEVKSFEELERSKWRSGAFVGGITGMFLGSIWAMAALSGWIPGIGTALFASSTAGFLATVIIGGVAGTIVGALGGRAMEDEVAAYEKPELRIGETQVLVTGDRLERAKDILRDHGARFARDGQPVTSAPR